MGSVARRRRWRSASIGFAIVALAVAATFAYQAGRRAAQLGAARNVAVHQALEQWRAAFERESDSANRQRSAADAAVTRLASRLAALQTRIIELDARGRRLAARAEFDGTEFDFGVDPAMGGPEDLIDGDTPRGAALQGAADWLAERVDGHWLQFSVLDDLLRWRKLSADVRPDGRPVATGYISSRYGRRIDPFTGQMAAHRGIDFAGPAGSEIVAVASGIVVWSGRKHGYGEVVEIDHGQGHVTRYAHNAENLVQVGDIVTRGQPIARLGDTGRATGPNLHFEVLRDGRAVNPRPYLD